MSGISDWPEEVISTRSSKYVHCYTNYIVMIVLTLHFFTFSIVQSFETITTNLVDQQNFTNLTVIETEVTMEANRVCSINPMVVHLLFTSTQINFDYLG